VSEADEENFLQRWLRRKSEAGETQGAESTDAEASIPGDDAVPVALEDGAPGEGAAVDVAAVDVAAVDEGAEAGDGSLEEQAPDEETEPAITDADLPALEDLDEDSDYSMFLAAGVSPDKRKAALRQLFHSPKFNITDGLDDYCEDFTKFEPLGDIVTADMRHHAERLLRKALAAEEAEEAEKAKEEEAALAAAEPEVGDPDLAEPPGPESESTLDPDATAGSRPDGADQNSASAEEPEHDMDKTKNTMNKGEQRDA
jgi:hypothetical protein